LELEIQTDRQLRRPVTKQKLNAKTNVRRNTASDTDAAQMEGGAELTDSAFKKILYYKYEK
jgi:propanediol dehydratase small subunit